MILHVFEASYLAGASAWGAVLTEFEEVSFDAFRLERTGQRCCFGRLGVFMSGGWKR